MEKIWWKNYEPYVPHEIDPDTYTSLVEMFKQNCERYHDRPALSNLGSQITYRAWYQKSRDFAAFLQHELKVQKGDRLAVILPNVMQYPVVVFGALMAGMIVVNVNPLYTVPELEHQLNDAGVSVVVVLSLFANTLERALPALSLKHIIVTEMGDLFSFPKSWLVNFAVKYVKKKLKPWALPQALMFKRVLKCGESLPLEEVALTASDIAFLQYTGGTTGIAKGAMLTHRNMIANLEQAAAWIGKHLTAGSEVVITALPLYHIFALMANCLVFIKYGGLNVLITDPRDISHFVKELKRMTFTAITGVNTLFNALLNHPEFPNLNFKSLKLALSGGMATQYAVASRWKNTTQVVLLQAYGLTETSPAVSINPMNLPSFNGSVGLPLPSTEISIRDEEDHERPLGEAGEVWVRGPQVMKGYWNNVAETQKVFASEGWLRTGDIGLVDQEGFLTLVDRKKDMIIVSGFNVYPNEVEDVIAAHPGVKEVAVLGIKDGASGEIVKAFIVKKDPHLTQENVIAYCRKQLTNYKVPKQVEFRDTLPKSNVGKVLRRALRAE